MKKSTTKRKTRSDKFTFTQKDVIQIEKMAALGLSIAHISSVFNISPDTLYRRMKDNNLDLSAAITRGKSKAIFKVANKAYELALSGDRSMIKYYLSTIGGWSEKTQITQESIPSEDSYTQTYNAIVQNALDSLSDEDLKTIDQLAQKESRYKNE